MRAALRAASAFTGICGFERGMEPHGVEFTCMIEWDAACRKVITEHYPTIPLLEDISDVRGTDLGRPEIFLGGFPCQDTSIGAPHRAGLAGKRSGHFYEFTRLVEEYQRLVDATNPRWVVIENPTGLLKSNGGRDMSTVVRTLEELGYGWAYRVVDARHLGTPQRRGRVLVVGHRGGDPRPAWQVLGDEGAGHEARSTHPVRRPTHGLRVVRDPDEDDRGELKVWRKSARARASLDKGGYETWVDDGLANTLTGFDGGLATRQTHLVRQHGRLRTLTLTEWERLQGFPDGWTAMVSSDAARFTALGNAIHVGTAGWLGARLTAVDAALPSIDFADSLLSAR